MEFAQRCGYFNDEITQQLDEAYDQVIGQLVKMIQEADKWTIK